MLGNYDVPCAAEGVTNGEGEHVTEAGGREASSSEEESSSESGEDEDSSEEEEEGQQEEEEGQQEEGQQEEEEAGAQHSQGLPCRIITRGGGAPLLEPEGAAAPACATGSTQLRESETQHRPLIQEL